MFKKLTAWISDAIADAIVEGFRRGFSRVGLADEAQAELNPPASLPAGSDESPAIETKGRRGRSA